MVGDRDGRWRYACVYDCGWPPVRRERKVVFSEPVSEEEISKERWNYTRSEEEGKFNGAGDSEAVVRWVA